MQWKSSHLAKPTFENPSRHGWTWNEEIGLYEPIMTDLSPAPESIVELSMCKCTTGCLTQRCKCKKNGFVCSELCHCTSCKNVEETMDTGRFCTRLLRHFLEKARLSNYFHVDCIIFKKLLLLQVLAFFQFPFSVSINL